MDQVGKPCEFRGHLTKSSMKTQLIQVGLAMISLGIHEASSQILVNGSFEAGFAGWTATGNQQIKSASPYEATDGINLVAFNGQEMAPDGVLSQTFSTVSGQTYTLQFDAGVLSYNTNSQSIQVTVNGLGSLFSQTITIFGLGGASNHWLPQSFTFVADSASATLTFRDQSSSTSALDLLLDHVRVTSGSSPGNTAPVAATDSYSTPMNVPLAVSAPGVLANDTDAQSNPLTAVIHANPSHGSIALNPNGSFTYTPATGYSGADSFTYHASDGSLESNIVAVNITVNSGHVATYAHYRMGDGSPSTNGGRNLPYDASGNGRHMVTAATGTPAISSSGGPNNDAFYTFSGDNQFYTGAAGGWDPPEDNVGVEVWVRTTHVAQLNAHVFGSGNNASGLNIGYDVTGGRGWFGAVAGKEFAGFVGSANYPGNTWIHLAVVRTSGTTTFFVNGNANGTSAAVPNNATGNEALRMAVNSDDSNPFQGAIAEARVFTFEAGSFNPATDLLFTPVTPGIVRELSVPTISGRSYIARFSILPVSGGTTVPRLQLSITGSSPLKEIALRTSLPAAAVSVPYIYKFTANSSTTVLRFTTLDGDSATAAQVAGLQVAEPLTLPPSTTPNARQQAQIDRRYGLFLHFGINTFTGNEWGSGAESPSIYQPTALDVDQWVRTASEAGMRYVLMISKHHDGFCMWDSGWTTHDVGSSSVKTDILAAAAAACRKYGIQMAIYYSLWDRHEPTYTSPIDDDYNQYMQRQLTELLGNYGPVCELWLDGAWEKANTRWPSIELYDLVRRLQPDCQVSTNWTIGLPWNPDANLILPVNQEQGYPIRYFPSDFRLGDPYLPKNPDPKVFSNNGNSYYLPFEATITLSGANNWFYHSDDVTDKSVSDLAALYGQATAQNNILVLNAPPDRRGRVRDLERSTLFQLRDQLGLKSGLSLPYGGTVRSVPGKIEAEDFDVGGPDVAYHDQTPANLGGQYRNSESVDIETTSDSGGGYRVTGTSAGEWLKYTITVASPGDYTLTMRTANAVAGGQAKVEIDGIEVSGLITIPQTGGMDAWQSVAVSGIQLGVGEHILRLVMVTDAPGGAVGAFNWISLASGSVNTKPHATGDSYSTDQALTLVVPAAGVLANDTDAEINPLTAVVDRMPSHGVLTLNSNGGFTYVPSAIFTGMDSFTYHANDGGLDSDVATVLITVNPFRFGPFWMTGSPGNIILNLSATRAGWYVLDRSDDLDHWERIDEQQVADPGMIQFFDTQTTGLPVKQIFYRIGIQWPP
jgi:alpha-L-fucosidase